MSDIVEQLRYGKTGVAVDGIKPATPSQQSKHPPNRG